MAVVINEFEVVAEREAGNDAAPNAAARGGGDGSTPRDVERIVARLRDRAARVRAD